MHGECELGLGMAEPTGSRWPAGQWFSMGAPQGTLAKSGDSLGCHI